MKRQRSLGDGVDEERQSPRRRFYHRLEFGASAPPPPLPQRSLSRKRFEYEPKARDGGERIHRRDYVKGFRSEREKSRREEVSSSSWRRSSNAKEGPSEEFKSVRAHRLPVQDDAVKKRVEERKENCSSSEREEGELEPDAIDDPGKASSPDVQPVNGRDDGDVKIKGEDEIGTEVLMGQADEETHESTEKEPDPIAEEVVKLEEAREVERCSLKNPEKNKVENSAETREEDQPEKNPVKPLNLEVKPFKFLKEKGDLDKGKGIAVSVPGEANSMNDDSMEGPSSRGFDLFSPRAEKLNNGVVMGNRRDTTQLDLSLSLPGVSSCQPSQNPNPNPNPRPSSSTAPPLSDGFATSASFSGSQRTIHNPSCSLTHTSMENSHWENSVGSRPLFKPVDQASNGSTWPAKREKFNGVLNQRCRNPQCRSVVPVDDCDCKVCSQRKGFCSACMCLVCGEFDSASNTCGWVGCDVCLHWCHTDCALCHGHIRNGNRGGGAGGRVGKEVQFLCVACGHPSEMFGFVKEVVRTCALSWGKEVLARELEFVRRIFAASEDARGASLHAMAATQLLSLEKNASSGDVVRRVLAFLSEADSPVDGGGIGGGGGSTGAATSSVPGPPPSYAMVAPSTHLGTSSTTLAAAAAGTGAAGDELDGVVKFKKAEAEMYQWRAEEARREAEGLRRIAAAKVGKIEEEFSRRLARLRLAEAEERRRLKLQELHSVDRTHRDFLHFKSRMEADIRDLLLKMDAAQSHLPR
ncbi:uncharacterized protein LOC144712101 [Wolffia australiana]